MTVTPPGKDYDVVKAVADFESGKMVNHHEVLRLFSFLIASGSAWTMQNSYRHTAEVLIDKGAIAPNGDILQDPDDEEDQE